MVERGDATPEDIDQAMELGAGYRESLFEHDLRCADGSHGCTPGPLLRESS